MFNVATERDFGPGRKANRGRVLVVDDELTLVRVYARALGAEGFQVLCATDGEMAETMFRRCKPDAVVSDIAMPGLDGLDLLRSLRQIDRDVPVIMATADQQDASAQRAVAEGALMYFVKPVDLRALAQIVGHATQVHRQALIARDAGTSGEPTIDTADLAARFESGLSKLWIAYQPIVRWSSLVVVGYEALARSDEPTLAQPSALFAAAECLDRTVELGRAIRARVAASMRGAPEKTRIFVNLHGDELQDDALYDASEPLRPFAHRVVFEITERADLDLLMSLAERIDRLRAAGFRIAIDDLGAGYAGLSSFAQLKPSVIKLDASLIRGIDKDSIRRKIVKSMITLCADTGVEVVGEGVETEEERQALGFLGCQYQQGFLYGRPQKGFGKPSVG